MQRLDVNNHSVFDLNYHLVLVIKYRRKVLNDKISERIKSIFEQGSKKYRVSIVEWNHNKDHIHVLFKASPNTPLSKYINTFKSASSRLIKKEFPEVTKFLWKSAFWTRSYCLITTGGAPLEVIKRYIEDQGQ